MTPAELPTEETLRYLTRMLPAPPLRLLEVGAGRGTVALALAARGYAVTALDEAVEKSGSHGMERVRWVEADFLYYEESEPYDVVLFTRSLHHMAPASRALDRAHAFLKPGGVWVAEEFAFDRVNLPTARWYYDLESIVDATGILAPETGILAPADEESTADGNPLGRWRREHAHDPPLQSGHDMLAAARERFEMTAVEEAPYLYRYLCDRLEESERGLAVARRFLEIESRLIRERDVAAAGLRMVGRRKG